MLPHAAGDIAVVRLPGRRTDDVDDDTAFTFAHVRIDDAREIDIAKHFHRPCIAPCLAVDLGQRTGRNIAGIIDENVDALAGIAELFELAYLAKVAAMHRDLDAMLLGEPFRQFLHRRIVARGEMQVAALRRHVFGDHEPDALGGAGDQDGFAFEIDVHCRRSLVNLEDFAGERGAHDLGRPAGDQVAARAPPHRARSAFRWSVPMAAMELHAAVGGLEAELGAEDLASCRHRGGCAMPLSTFQAVRWVSSWPAWYLV